MAQGLKNDAGDFSAASHAQRAADYLNGLQPAAADQEEARAAEGPGYHRDRRASFSWKAFWNCAASSRGVEGGAAGNRPCLNSGTTAARRRAHNNRALSRPTLLSILRDANFRHRVALPKHEFTASYVPPSYQPSASPRQCSEIFVSGFRGILAAPVRPRATRFGTWRTSGNEGMRLGLVRLMLFAVEIITARRTIMTFLTTMQNRPRVFGGQPEDYLAIHNWFDATKENFCDFRHRALRHHAEGIFECERVFGTTT
jgi:hypothetical protein